MTDHLDSIFQRQYALQRRYGYDFHAMDQAELCRYLAWNNQAAVAELVEALGEFRWKTWTQGDAWLNRKPLIGELVDVLCFLVNQLLALGVSAADLDHAHQAKTEVNENRRTTGYTGRDKCSQCGRAPDEPAQTTKETPIKFTFLT